MVDRRYARWLVGDRGRGARVASAGLFLALSLLGRADDWPHWRGPSRNGISKETGWLTAWPPEGPQRLWSATVGIGFSSVAVAQGRAFTLGNTNETDTVWCFDAANGKERWRHSYPCPPEPQYYEGGPGSTPAVDGDRVFTLSKRGHLFCFDAANGKVVWRKDLMEELGVKKPRWGFAGSPLVAGNLLILNVGDAGTAIAKANGKVVWTSGKEASGYATPMLFTVGGERCVLIFGAKFLVAVKVKSGQELWRYPWVTKWDVNAPDPIPIGDKLFVSTFSRGCALLRFTTTAATLVWENKSMANHFNSCVLLEGFLYGVDGNTDQAERDLRCVDLATGEVKWRYPGLGMGSLMAADGKLIVLSDKGELLVAVASPVGFRPIAQAQVLGGKCWTTPVLAHGRLYCRNAQGTLVCLDLRGAKR